MRAWFWERIEKKNGVLEPSRHALCHAVSSKLVDIWSSYSIPTVSIKKIRDMVGETLNKHQKIRKNYNRDNGNPSFNIKLEEFRKNAKKLFDIAACRCNLTKNQCNCHECLKVPKEEVRFLKDQRGSRAMVIGDIDKKTTKRRVKVYLRKLENKGRKSSFWQPSTSAMHQAESFPSTADDESSSDYTEDDDAVFEIKSKKHKQNRIKLPSLSLSCHRGGISDRHGALLASSVLRDVGVINEDNTNMTILFCLCFLDLISKTASSSSV